MSRTARDHRCGPRCLDVRVRAGHRAEHEGRRAVKGLHLVPEVGVGGVDRGLRAELLGQLEPATSRGRPRSPARCPDRRASPVRRARWARPRRSPRCRRARPRPGRPRSSRRRVARPTRPRRGRCCRAPGTSDCRGPPRVPGPQAPGPLRARRSRCGRDRRRRDVPRRGRPPRSPTTSSPIAVTVPASS